MIFGFEHSTWRRARQSPYFTPRYAISLLWRLPLGLIVGGFLGAIGNMAVPVLGGIGGFLYGVYICLHISWGEPQPRVRGPGSRARNSYARPWMLAEERKKIDIDRADADLLLSFCEPDSTPDEPFITEENLRRFVVAQADAERQRRLARERLGATRDDTPAPGNPRA